MNIDKKEFSDTKENNWQVLISVVISIVITLIGLWGSLETRSTCMVFGVAAILLLITGRLVKNKYPEECKNIISSAISILIVSLIAYFTIDSTPLEGSFWYQTLRDSEDEELLSLIDKADNGGDGLAQAELSDYYDSKKDFPKARLYATKASNNWNARAFYRLAEYDINGLGCEVDIRDGINHFINALRLERFDYSNFLNELSQKEKDLSPTDSMRLALFLQSHEYVDSMIEDSFNYSRRYNNSIEGKNKESNSLTTLNYASLSGYRNATVALYLLVPHLSPESHRLAEVLYNVAYIPTNTIERAFFFRDYYGESYYDTDQYERYIKDNDYSLLFNGEGLLNRFLSRSYDVFSYQGVIKEYVLFRSQYQWIKNRNIGVIPSVNYLHFMNGGSQLAKQDERIARELLRYIIIAVQSKMNNPSAWDESDRTKDLLKSDGLELSFEYN